MARMEKIGKAKPGFWGRKGVVFLALALVFGAALLGASPARATTTATDPMAQENFDPCGGGDGSIDKALDEASLAYITYASSVANQTYRNHKTSSYMECAFSLAGYFQKISMLLDTSVSWMGKIILGLLATLMNFACKYVVNAINSALSSVMCLSLPTIGFSVSMPGMPSSSCDGVSLLDLMQAQGSFKTNIPYSSSSLGMSLGLEQLVKHR